MKFVIVLAAVVACVLANANDQTVKFDVDNIGVDSYKYA